MCLYSLLRWIINALILMLIPYIVPGVSVESFFTALVVAVVLALVNTLIKPLLILFTLPINILTLGLFTFVVNALMLLIVSAVIPGFDVRGFWTAVGGALIISVASWLLNRFIGATGRVETGDYIDLKQRRGRWE